MIAAFARLSTEHPASQLLLVGEGSLRDEVVRLVQARGLGERIRLLGVRRDVPEVLSAADGYVLSSAWEGMPVALLEAASVELPIVATRVGGVPEVVEDGSTGLLIPPGDPLALAEAMARIESLSSEARELMGRRGRLLIEERYGTDRILQMWDRIYSECANVSRDAAGGQR
jgi:glycosyltransferase involved in cell wall biosynthesis